MNRFFKFGVCGLLLASALFTASCGKTAEKGDKGDQGIQGVKGEDGNGILRTEINDKNELIIYYTDGTSTNLGVINQNKDDSGEGVINTFKIAKDFGYQGNYGEWVKEIVQGTLSVQYSVNLSNDYKKFTYGWDNKEVTLSETNILLDDRLTDEEVNSHKFIYNDITEAIKAATNGTNDNSMNIYFAPGVYWTHDPNSESTENAFTITKECANMKWIGLTDDYRNVVIAFNYGHNVGFNGGNPTCFNISGDGFEIKNLTVGGYCNIDLDFALNRTKNQEKRSTDITQCQLGSYNGDKLYCKNVAFISRLNMMPFNNSKRALYENCHLESTDDSLNGSREAVYLNCEFEFYASKPWGGSSGATLLNCDMYIKQINVGTDPHQYFTKMAGRVNVIDSRFHDDTNQQTFKIGWSDILSNTFRSYYSNVTYNGVKTDFSDGGKNADKGIDLTGTEALKAYKLVTSKGKVIYNVYNLLCGSDDWDPLNQKAEVLSLGGVGIPTTLTAKTTAQTLETGNLESDTATLSYEIFTHQQKPYAESKIVSWEVSDAQKDLVILTPNENGTCLVKANNNNETAETVIINAVCENGLAGAVQITVKPSLIPVDKATNINITQNLNGNADVTYVIENLGNRDDNSRINWYICDDEAGTNSVLVKMGKGNVPLKSIKLEPAWVGKYLKVTVESKHIRSDYAEIETYISPNVILETGIEPINNYNVQLDQFVTTNRSDAGKGFWNVNNVSYGTGGKNGFNNYTGLYFTGNKTSGFSGIYYDPTEESYKDMDVTLKVAPGKTAGQGFGSNNNFIEVRVKYDYQTESGYALRIVRTSGDSTKVQLVKLGLDNEGVKTVEVLAESGNTSVYLTECTIHVWTENGKIYTHIETSQNQPQTAIDKGYLAQVNLEADIVDNQKGGFGVYYESSTADNTTYIGEMNISWTK